jgi:quinol monooxygenase YgiN
MMRLAGGDLEREALMYAVIRKFNRMRSPEEAARRAEAGLIPILRQSAGFRGYYVVRSGDEMIVSITMFDTQDAVQDAHLRAVGWIKDNLSDLVDGEPEVISGEVVISATAPAEMAA